MSANQKEKENSKVCAGCMNVISDKHFICCTSVGCKKLFHNQCINLPTASKAIKDKWICPDCLCVAKKGGDNTATPVRGNPTDNVTLRKQAKNVSDGHMTATDSGTDILTVLAKEIRLLREDVSNMKLTLERAFETIVRCEERVGSVETGLSAIEVRLEAAEEKLAEAGELKTRVFELEYQLNYQVQQSLRSEVEIIGIPEQHNENPDHIFMLIAAKVGINIHDADIEYATRTGQRRKDGDSPGKSRPLVVRFTSRRTRDNFYKAARSRRLNSTDIGVNGPTVKIYFNERLTRENRFLFRESRTRASAAKYKHCWTSGGTIYVRKRDGNGPGNQPIPIKTLQDLDRIVEEDSGKD